MEIFPLTFMNHMTTSLIEFTYDVMEILPLLHSESLQSLKHDYE